MRGERPSATAFRDPRPRPATATRDRDRDRVPRPRPRPATATALLAIAIAAGLSAADPEPVLRELYVPFAEFHALTQSQPDGVVMALNEYRGLVAAARRRLATDPPPDPPPIGGVVTTARYEGVLGGQNVRFTARLSLRIALKGWVSVMLGELPAGFGGVLVDNKPGWIVLEEAPPAAVDAQKSAAPPVRQAFLLVEGLGAHEVDLRFTLPVQEIEDRTRVAGSFAPAAASRIEILVPSLVDAQGEPATVESQVEGASTNAPQTRIVQTLGAASRFSLEWRERRGTGERRGTALSAALLAADHRVTLYPRSDSPAFAAETRVSIHRRKVAEVVLREPAGARVLDVTGELVSSWTRDGSNVHVLLRERFSGEVRLRLAGSLEPEAAGAPDLARFVVGVPVLEGATSESGTVAVVEPLGGRLTVESATGLVEAAVGEVAELPAMSAPEGARPVSRLFLASRGAAGLSEARLAVSVRALPVRLETRAAWRLHAGETRVVLEGDVRVEVEEGRTAALSLFVPDAWRLVTLEERPAAPPELAQQVQAAAPPVPAAPPARAGAGLTWSLAPDAPPGTGGRTVLIQVDRTVDSRRPLWLRLRLEATAYDSERSWSRRDVTLALPRVPAAARSRTDLALLLEPSLDALVGDLPSWRPLGPDELHEIALAPAAGVTLAAGLTTREASPGLAFSLVHRPPRGESQSVTHVLILDRALRVRTDLQIAVVDRAVDALVLRLPVAAGRSAQVVGPGIKEVETDDATGRRTVRFHKPWLGERRLRVEFELAPAADGTVPFSVPFSVPLPVVLLESTPDGGSFGSERFLVLEGMPSVEVSTAPGAGVAPADPDEVPDFAEPHREGRVLSAYRFRATGEPGRLTTRALERAPTVRRHIPRLELSTVISADGITRTRAHLILASSGESALRVRLPAGARLLSAAVGGEAVHGVRREPGPRDAESATEVSVPLPARSHVEISLEHERAHDGPLSSMWGSWIEIAPDFLDVPVGSTAWSVDLPDGFHFRLDRGDLEATPSTSSGPRRLGGSKTGGNAVLSLGYEGEAYGRAAPRSVLLLTVLVGLGLLGAGRWRLLARLVVGGLFLGTLVPIAIGWRSSLALEPLSRGLVVVGAVLVAAWALRWGRGRLARRRGPVGAALAALVGVIAFAWASDLYGAESPAPQESPFAPVLIPVDPEALPGTASAKALRAFVPRARFDALWRLAHPEEAALSAPPRDVLLGPAAYTVSIEGNTFRVRGSWEVLVLADRWVSVPMPIEGVRIASLRIDGRESGPLASKEGVLALPFPRRGAYRIEVELVGDVRREAGELRIAARLLPAPAARVRLEIPKDIKAIARGAGLTPVESGAAALVDLPPDGRFDVALVVLGGEGRMDLRLESIAAQALSPTRDGVRVDRLERISATGEGPRRLVFQVLGGLEVETLSAADVAEWNVLAAVVGEPTRIEVLLRKPLSSLILEVHGRATIADALTAAPALTLEGAARAETWIALERAAGRRFLPESLAGMRRASVDELARTFPGFLTAAPDRVHQAHGSVAAERIALGPLPREVSVATSVQGLIEVNRVAVSVRSRYRVSGAGPLRHEVALPAGWEVRSVRGAAVRSHESLTDAAGQRLLVVHFNGRAEEGIEFIWTAERLHTTIPESLALPSLRRIASADEPVREALEWSVAADDGLEISAAQLGSPGWSPVSVDGVEGWIRFREGASPRLAFRSLPGSTAPDGPTLRVASRASALAATVVSFARLEEESLQVNARVVYRMRGAGRDRFALRLPAGAELSSLASRNQKSRDVRAGVGGAGATIEIVLQSRSSGEHTIEVAYRVPRPPAGRAVLAPLVVLDGQARLEAVDQLVGVVQGGSALVRSGATAGLVAVEAEQLPYLPEGVDASSLRPTFRATALDWSVELAEEEIEVERGADAVVTLAQIHTVLGSDGRRRTRAVFSLKNRALQLLDVDLPPSAVLHGVLVDGRPATAAVAPPGAGGGSGLRIAVERAGRGTLELEVAILYEERDGVLPRLRGSTALRGPRLRNAQVVETVWTVELPSGYTASLSGGNVRETASSAAFSHKVENLLGQYQELTRARGEAATRRAREESERELLRLEQALGDNVAGLEETLARGSGGAADVQEAAKERDRGARILKESQEARDRLREERDQKAKAPPAPAQRSRAEQNFQDVMNYQKRAWRWNTQSVAGEKELQAPGTSLDALLERSPFNAFAALGPAAALGLGGEATPIETSQAEPIGASQRQEKVAGAAGAIEETVASPVLDLPPTDPRHTVRTFQRPGGDAALELSLTRSDAVPQIAAAVALVVGASLIALVLWRRRR